MLFLMFNDKRKRMETSSTQQIEVESSGEDSVIKVSPAADEKMPNNAAAASSNVEAATVSKQIVGIESESTSIVLEDVTQLSPEYLQRKLYFLVDELKRMHAQLSEDNQIRISYELLTELANSLLNDTIFEIVKGLMEIQHVTEKHLQQLREQVENEYQIEVQEWISKISDPEELDHILSLMKLKHTKKLKETDMKLIALLDQKVKDQQSILQKAGVAGFYVTENPKEIKIQMFLLDFILRLSRIKFEPNK